MCGRYTLTTPAAELAERFLVLLTRLAEPPRARFNISPSQTVLAVTAGRSQAREAGRFVWGLVPPWSRDGRPGPINAKAETAAHKPFFRHAVRRQRCLVPADGFYEWKRLGSRKIPFRFTLRDGAPFAFAGIWERWEGGDGTVVESCAILTTEPNALVADVHDRMPVILRPGFEGPWLDRGVTDPGMLAAAFAPYPAEDMTAYPVSTRVNSPRNDDPGLVAPVA